MSFVPEKGGAAYSLIMPNQNDEKELLYLHDFFWEKELPDLPGGWPFCFPICARLERNGIAGDYLYDGQIYNMPIHGFSWWLPWTVVLHQDHEIILSLRDNATTQRMYPFAFEVKLHYKLDNHTLQCLQTYTNHSRVPMPYYAGFHPYFLTPPAEKGKEKVMLDYKPIQRLIYNNRLTDLIGKTTLFNLPASISNPDINEQLTRVGQDKLVRLIYADGFEIQMQANGVKDPDLFPYVQLYTISEKPFFCIEPWMACPNALNTVQGVRWLKPLQSESGILTLTKI